MASAMYPNIEAERARLGLTINGLAQRIGVTPKTIWNWQHGVHVIPSNKLVQLCDLFDCSMEYLLQTANRREV